jgi:hypothetical protein
VLGTCVFVFKQQVLQCPRMTAFVRYCQEQQRRREAGIREMVDWY